VRQERLEVSISRRKKGKVRFELRKVGPETLFYWLTFDPLSSHLFVF